MPKCSNLEEDKEELKRPQKRLEHEEKELNDHFKSLHENSYEQYDEELNEAEAQEEPDISVT